ncbi:MAG: M1 family metallopeptidase [Thermoanaerobaculia bacterium]
MKTRLVCLLTLAFALSLLSTPRLEAQPKPPEFRLPAGAHPTRMTVDLTIVPEKETFDGKVRIDLEMERPTSVVWLNAHDLEIHSIEVTAGGPAFTAAALAGGEDFVGVDFGRTLPAGKASLDIAYRGKLDAVETEGVFRQQDAGSWYAFSQFESTFARRAFPCFDEPAFRVPWKLTLHVKADNVAVANTSAVAERPEADGMKAVEFQPTHPISSYLVAFGVGPFSLVDSGTWGAAKTPIRMVVARGQGAKAAYAAEVTGPLLAELEKYFEIPYAFGKLDNLSIPQTVQFGAMENPGLITYVDRLLLADPAHQTLERQRAYAGTAAHENAHLWFGDLVTMQWWDDIWLNEGFATWMAGKIVARWKPEWGGENENAGRRSEAMGADSLASSQAVRRAIHSNGDIESAFDGISYAKGGSLLSMFETWMGPENFRKGIQRYLKSHAWGNATSQDFLAALSAEGAPEVAQSFATFLDQPGVPVVTVALSCQGGKGELTLSQRRYVPLGSPVETAQLWRVPVTVRYGSGDQSAIAKVMVEGSSTRSELPTCPEWVQANHGGFGYYVSEYKGELLDRLASSATRLPLAEQVALIADTRFLFSAGDLSAEAALAVVPRFENATSHLVIDAALDLAYSVEDNLVADGVRSNYERYLAASFGKRARAIGLAQRDGETLDDTLIRPRLERAFGTYAADAATLAEARRLTEAWLGNSSAIRPDMLGTVLGIAAAGGDVTLFDRLEAAAVKEQDRRARRQILEAIGRFRDPAAVDEALALVLSGKFDIREASTILWTLSGERVTRQRVFEWVKTSFDPLSKAMPEKWAAGLVLTSAGFCDAAQREKIAAFFGPRESKLAGGDINLAKTLDLVGICIGRREKQEAGVSSFLQAY